MSDRCIDGNCPRWNPCKEGECAERAASEPAMTTPSTPTSTMKEAERLVRAYGATVVITEACHGEPELRLANEAEVEARDSLLAFIRSLVEAQPCAVAGEALPWESLGELHVDAWGRGQKRVHAGEHGGSITIEATNGEDAWRATIPAPWVRVAPSSLQERALSIAAEADRLSRKLAAGEGAAAPSVPPEFSRDDDGELLMDWSPSAGRMVSLSLRADGRLSYALTWDGEKQHGTATMPAAASPGGVPTGLSDEQIEAMICACVPGGDTCDPQHIADAIRAHFHRAALSAGAPSSQEPTDAQMLDWVEAQGNGMPWLARQSETGRGFRLHNDRDGLWATARYAIRAEMLKESPHG